MSNASKIPEPIRGAIKRYVFEGIRPGHFLTEVISNNLFGAIARADEASLEALPEITKFFYNRTPSSCWGSPTRLQEWVKMDQSEREKKTDHFKADLAYL